MITYKTRREKAAAKPGCILTFSKSRITFVAVYFSLGYKFWGNIKPLVSENPGQRAFHFPQFSLEALNPLPTVEHHHLKVEANVADVLEGEK